MKLKLDENVPLNVPPLLASLGYDVATVPGEDLAGADDPTVAAAAFREGRMLLTLDKGFADIRRYPPGQHPGIIVVRLKDQQPDAVESALRSLLVTHDLDALTGCTLIVQARLVRIRWPEPEATS